jgi:hypothetical protein
VRSRIYVIGVSILPIFKFFDYILELELYVYIVIFCLKFAVHK